MMPTSIILGSVFASWTLFWAIIASGIVAVTAITALLAVVTNPRRHGTHRRAAAAPPHGELTTADVDSARHHALV